MKKFYEISKTPLIVGIVAAVVFSIDSILKKYLWIEFDVDAHFVWITFLVWAVAFGMKNHERIRFLIGVVIGFLGAVFMIHFGGIFDASVLGIGIAMVIGVFIFSTVVMYFDHLKKFWMNSITGIFFGAPLTFSGLGVALAPMTFCDAGLMFAIMMTYAVFGCLCALACVYLMGKWNKPTETKKTA